ncbi:hypothetical protein [Thermoanaerobacter thermohydrosulfuricus]|nr:hypothetical protein [Thermoanaerobacter thermohydrosulfuricus]
MMLMLRRAIIKHLRENITEIGGRVYQAYLAAEKAKRPYITVRLAESIASEVISFGGTMQIELFVYDDLGKSYLNLDYISDKIIAVLNGAYITDQEDGKTYYIEWNPTTNDIIEEDRKLIGRLLRFKTAILHERRI